MTEQIDTVAAVNRIMLSLDDELLDKLTEMAKGKGLSRASYIRMVLTEHVTITRVKEVAEYNRQLIERARLQEESGLDTP